MQGWPSVRQSAIRHNTHSKRLPNTACHTLIRKKCRLTEGLSLTESEPSSCGRTKTGSVKFHPYTCSQHSKATARNAAKDSVDPSDVDEHEVF